MFKSPVVALETHKSPQHLMRESCGLLAVLATALVFHGLDKTLTMPRSSASLQTGSAPEQFPSATHRWQCQLQRV